MTTSTYYVLMIVEKRGECPDNVCRTRLHLVPPGSPLLLAIQTNASAKFQPYERRTVPISLKMG
uniref:Uncharacterized protein n=1 Tax=Wuchereria bancrofti TaxID=6293 RepID=A0A1I8EBD7_WUCBA